MTFHFKIISTKNDSKLNKTLKRAFVNIVGSDRLKQKHFFFNVMNEDSSGAGFLGVFAPAFH